MISRAQPHTEQNDSDYTPWPQTLQDTYTKKGFWNGSVLGDILFKSAKAVPNKIAIIANKKHWTYQELHEKADQLASGFMANGIYNGSHVVVQMTNSGEFFEVLFALFRIGAIPVLALPSHRYTEIHYFCQHSKAVAYIASDKFAGFNYQTLGQRLLDEKYVRTIIIAGEAHQSDTNTNIKVVKNTHSLNDLYLPATSRPAPKSSDVALFQLSGGSTGLPKLIPRAHDEYFYSVRASALVSGLTHTSVYLAALPVMHNFALSSPGALGILWSAGTLVLSETGAPDITFTLIQKHKVTITALVPPLALTWMDTYENIKNDKKKPDLSSLKVLQVGGAKFSESAARRVPLVLECQLQQVFGMAEGLVNYTRLHDDPDTIYTTQGRPLSSADEIRIVNDNDAPVTQGETGHLLTRGPYTIHGYFRAKEHNVKSFTADGFYRTGDLVSMTKDGYLIVEGRAKDQINRGGEKIAAEEIENYLLAHEDIHDAALVAMPDEYLGERSCAFIVLRHTNNPSIKTKDILRFLHSCELSTYKIPDRIEIVESLPKTKLGKIDKKTLRKHIAKKLERITTADKQKNYTAMNNIQKKQLETC